MSDESKIYPSINLLNKINVNIGDAPRENLINPLVWDKLLPENNKTLIRELISFSPKPHNNIIELPRVVIVPGNENGLLELMRRIPQADAKGNLRYLLTSGVAIELITGFKRLHHDLDIVAMVRDVAGILGVDVVTPQKYFAGMQFDPKYLQDTAYQVQFKDAAGQTHVVSTVHPAILLVQKLSDWHPAPIRPKDIIDAAHIFSYWMRSLSGDPSWNPIIQEALRALPERQRKVTSERLKLLLNGNTSINYTPLGI